MKQIKVRWGDLGSPTRPGRYRYGPDMVEVTPGDINGRKHRHRSGRAVAGVIRAAGIKAE
jgi:hypothetical protein